MSASQVTLRLDGQLNPADRATLASLLLDKGLEVVCRHEHGADLASAVDLTVAAAKLEAEIKPPSESPAPRWKPWFPVIDYSRCTNCMQCLSFCLFDAVRRLARPEDPGPESIELQDGLSGVLTCVP